MSKTQTDIVAWLTLVVFMLALVTPAEAAGARLEGYLLGVDGRAASGFKVHLIDGEGADVAQASTSDEGLYRFRDLSSGSYSLGIEDREGQMAPVSAPPVRLDDDELARRDIKLLQAGQLERDRVGRENFSFGVFWAGLSPVAKAGSVIGTFVLVGLTIEALDDEADGAEPDGSEVN
jgi:hypothetical protein